MARLDTDFTFLRRSFFSDIEGRELACEVPRIRDAVERAFLRSSDAVVRDRTALETAVRAWR